MLNIETRRSSLRAVVFFFLYTYRTKRINGSFVIANSAFRASRLLLL